MPRPESKLKEQQEDIVDNYDDDLEDIPKQEPEIQDNYDDDFWALKVWVKFSGSH